MRCVVTQNFKANGFRGVPGHELTSADLEKIGEASFKNLVKAECIFVDDANPPAAEPEAPAKGEEEAAEDEETVDEPAAEGELPEEPAKVEEKPAKGKKKKG